MGKRVYFTKTKPTLEGHAQFQGKRPRDKVQWKMKAGGETKVLRTKRDHNEVIHHGDSKI